MNRINQLMLLSIFSVLVGCSSSPPDSSGIGVLAGAETENFSNKLKTDNPKLAQRLKITDVKSRQSNSFLEVNVQLASSFNQTQHLQYQFTWYDKDSFVVEANKQAWKPLNLHGGQLIKLAGVAPSSTAVSFHLYVREVNSKAYEFEN